MSDYPPEKDRPKIPHSESSGLIVHIIDEMPVHVVFAVMFVVFFFVWGGVNNVIKLFGRDVSSIETPVGVYAGLFSALATPFVIWRVKRRKK
jgi:hypothetical protein